MKGIRNEGTIDLSWNPSQQSFPFSEREFQKRKGIFRNLVPVVCFWFGDIDFHLTI
jgi:hypothetical protein